MRTAILSDSEWHLCRLIQLSVGLIDGESFYEEKIDWDEVYRLSVKHALVGIAFAGIEQLPKKMYPEKVLLFKWLGQTEWIKHQNEINMRCSVDMTRIFADLGFRSVILKGQSNSVCYPHPEFRSSGDVDIWVDGARKELISLARSKWETANLQFHHIECEIMNSASSEIHFKPMVLYNFWYDRRLNSIFTEEKEHSFTNEITLGTAGTINILTHRANVMMQLAHLYHHLFIKGIGLRQMLDYCLLLRSNIQDSVRVQLAGDIRGCGMSKFAGAVSWVLQEVFLLDRRYLIIVPDEKEGRFLLNEIMVSGNFGEYDTRYGSDNMGSGLKNFLFLSYRNLRLLRHYPMDCIWNVVYRLCQYVWKIRYVVNS